MQNKSDGNTQIDGYEKLSITPQNHPEDFFFFLHILTLNKEDEDPIILNKYVLEKFGPQSCINNLLYVSSRWFKVTE